MHTLAQQIDDNRPWLFTLFNITGWWGVVWVSVGFGGQFMFMMRLTVQWLATEKSRKSVVPPAYWWLSLFGALMLTTYFVWRKDVVGVLGQSFGWFIYLRNLYFIYKQEPEQEVLA